ncbi:MAG: P-II family nitrogen regulator [Proteobacteria bacterium]|jgi:nitrogen regulatory protein P-II 1|nr:P-II family nitrogen regulator [Pseudomonadota bacterium]
MEFAKVVAIIRPEVCRKVEERLKEIGVSGVSISNVKGWGEYADFYRDDWLVEHVKLEVYCNAARAEGLAEQLMDAAHTGLEGDGIVAVIPVQAVYHIRTRTRCEDEPC